MLSQHGFSSNPRMTWHHLAIFCACPFLPWESSFHQNFGEYSFGNSCFPSRIMAFSIYLKTTDFPSNHATKMIIVSSSQNSPLRELIFFEDADPEVTQIPISLRIREIYEWILSAPESCLFFNAWRWVEQHNNNFETHIAGQNGASFGFFFLLQKNYLQIKAPYRIYVYIYIYFYI